MVWHSGTFDMESAAALLMLLEQRAGFANLQFGFVYKVASIACHSNMHYIICQTDVSCWKTITLVIGVVRVLINKASYLLLQILLKIQLFNVGIHYEIPHLGPS